MPSLMGWSSAHISFGKCRELREALLRCSVVSSEGRNYLPIDLLGKQAVISNKCFLHYMTALHMEHGADRFPIALGVDWGRMRCLEMRFSVQYLRFGTPFPYATD